MRDEETMMWTDTEWRGVVGKLSPSHSSAADTGGWCSAAAPGRTSAGSGCSLWSRSCESPAPVRELHRWRKNYKYHMKFRLFSTSLHLSSLCTSHRHDSWWCWHCRWQAPCRWAGTLRWAPGWWRCRWCAAAGPTPPPYDPAGPPARAGSWRCLRRRGTVPWVSGTPCTWQRRPCPSCRRCPEARSTPGWAWCRWSWCWCCAEPTGVLQIMGKNKQTEKPKLDCHSNNPKVIHTGNEQKNRPSTSYNGKIILLGRIENTLLLI